MHNILTSALLSSVSLQCKYLKSCMEVGLLYGLNTKLGEGVEVNYHD